MTVQRTVQYARTVHFGSAADCALCLESVGGEVPKKCWNMIFHKRTQLEPRGVGLPVEDEFARDPASNHAAELVKTG